jgi:hypothetical protein
VGEKGQGIEAVRARSSPRAPTTQGCSQTEFEKVVLAPFDLLDGTSASTRWPPVAERTSFKSH